jgi:hypothetical protein
MNLSEFNEKTYQPENDYPMKPQIICNDGFKMSVQGSRTHYSTPRANMDFYSNMGIGFPTEKVDYFLEYAEDENNPTDTVYGYVPVNLIQKCIDDHQGINVELTFA